MEAKEAVRGLNTCFQKAINLLILSSLCVSLNRDLIFWLRLSLQTRNVFWQKNRIPHLHFPRSIIFPKCCKWTWRLVTLKSLTLQELTPDSIACLNWCLPMNTKFWECDLDLQDQWGKWCCYHVQLWSCLGTTYHCKTINIQPVTLT